MQQPVPFGKYILLERVSVGGMAEVFKAKSFGVKGFHKVIAIKKILPQLAEDAHFVDMFVNEAKTAVQLNHANICQIFDLGREGNDHFIAMEYISGKDLLSLHNYFRRTRTKMPVHLVAYIAAKIAEGLDYAHRKRGPDGESLGIVHRDVSPQNVIVSYDGGVKIIDFGIAKARSRNHQETQAGILKGKFGYMSPEQIEGVMEIDHRSDIFAIGTVVHELLTSKRLFLGDSDFATLEMVRNAEIPAASLSNPEVPPEMDRILFRALARRPEDRYQWASDMADELTNLVHVMGYGFSAQSLGDWMVENFAADIAKEKARHEIYAQIDGVRPQEAEDAEDATRVDDSPQMEDEEETALWQPLAEDMSPPPASIRPPSPPPITSERPAVPRPTWTQPGALSQATPSPGSATMPPRQANAPVDRNTLPPLLSERRVGGTTRRDLFIAFLLVVLAGAGGVLAYRALDTEAPAALTAGLVVRVEPPDEVTIYMDNQVVAGRSPFVHNDLAVGAHSLRVERTGYQTWQGQVTLVADEVRETQVKLVPARATTTAKVLFALVPSDAELTVDGRKVTPAELASYMSLPGDRAVEISATREGFVPYHESLRADPGVSRTHAVALVPTRGSMFIDSDPPGEVLVDGERRGRTPQNLQDFDVTREYLVRIERPGYETFEERVRFGEKRILQVEPKLKPAPR